MVELLYQLVLKQILLKLPSVKGLPLWGLILLLALLSGISYYYGDTVVEKLTEGDKSGTPHNTDNACEIFREYPEWLGYAVAVQQQYGVPIYVQLSIIYHESGFNPEGTPSVFGMSVKPSTATGYTQALDGTWGDYSLKSQYDNPVRSNMEHSMDFIGWYAKENYRVNEVLPTDPYNLYLAYHEGFYGYKNGTYEMKLGLQDYAKRVFDKSQNYMYQLKTCGIIDIEN